MTEQTPPLESLTKEELIEPIQQEREAIRALLSEMDALRKFVEAKMHHLPIEDQYVASVLVAALAQEQGY